MPQQAAQSEHAPMGQNQPAQAEAILPTLPPQDLFALKRFAAALRPDSDNLFNETLALDAASAALVNRGFIRDEQNPDFLVVAKYSSNSRAVITRGPGANFFGAYGPWPAYQGGGVGVSYSPGYRSSNISQLNLTLFFVKPPIKTSTSQNKEAFRRQNFNKNPREQATPSPAPTPSAAQISASNMLWQGQGSMVSSRNVFTSLACLAAGIVQEFPQSVRLSEKKMELQQCPNIEQINLAPSDMR